LPSPQQNGEVGSFGIGNRKIEIAVAIEVAGSKIVRILSACERRPCCCDKVPFAIAEQHLHGPVNRVRYDQVELPS